MTAADRTFLGILALSALIFGGLVGALIRLLSATSGEAYSTFQAFGSWCLHLLTGSAASDELLLLAIVTLLPAAALAGSVSLGRQWWWTHRRVQSWLAGRAARPSTVLKLAARLGIAERIDIVPSGAPHAFCYGWIRPRIGVSTSLLALLSQLELEAVLLHERHHLAHRDPLKLLIVRSLGQAFFFFPAIRQLAEYFAAAKELAADRAVVQVQRRPHWLASALYKMLSNPAASPDPAVIAGMDGLAEARIRQILDPQPSRQLPIRLTALGVSSLAVGILGILLVAPELVGAGTHIHPLTGHLAATRLIG